MDYQDPEIAAMYELANPLAEDAMFYLTLAGPQSCDVLDLGCGTGTLCCSFAERGHRVTGVDPAAAMLTVGKSKPYAERVEWVESSAQTYRSSQRFDLIVMTGHAFQVLLSDAEALSVLETMRGHLKTSGRIAFETRNPRIDWPGEWAGRSRVLGGGQITEDLKITEANGEFVSFQTSYQLSERTLTTNSTLRFPSREHIEALIIGSGLVVHNTLGDWNAGPFEDARSREMIFIAQLPE